MELLVFDLELSLELSRFFRVSNEKPLFMSPLRILHLYLAMSVGN